MGASHSHHDHDHGHRDFTGAFAIGIALNVGFVLVEIVFGFKANSMALLSDAGHNFSDVLGLGVAWAGGALARRGSSPRFTYGFKKASILAALANALLLFVAVGAIGAEAIRRLVHPSLAQGETIMVVAAVGIVINGFTALLFMRGQHDINIRGAFLHMAADALVTAGVVVTGIAVALTGLAWLDPAVSLVVSAVIVYGTWGLLRDSTRLALDAVPDAVDATAVRAHLAALPGVAAIHDLHIWGMSTTETALTCHLVMPGGHPGDAALGHIARELEQRFGIHHATIQIELGDSEEACVLTPESVV